MGRLLDEDDIIREVEKESNVDGAYGYMDTKSIIDLVKGLPSAQSDIARDIATIIENEQDMRVILKNAEFDTTITEMKGTIDRWTRQFMGLTEKQIVKELMIKYGFAAPDMTVTEFVEDILPSAETQEILNYLDTTLVAIASPDTIKDKKPKFYPENWREIL